MTTREKMKKEAELRLAMLNLHPNVLKEFKADGSIYYSERTPLGGILYWLNNEPNWENEVKKVEEEYNILVYHATHEYTSFGECLTCLYVSQDEEEWEYDREDLKTITEHGRVIYAFVINLNDPFSSEFGGVGIKEASGGLIRTC